MKRRWIKLESQEPPVTTARARYWLQLWIPERVNASPSQAQERGLALGVYLGSGSFRLAGDPNCTTEHVTAWRRLAGRVDPVTEEYQSYGQTDEVHAERGAQEADRGGAQAPA